LNVRLFIYADKPIVRAAISLVEGDQDRFVVGETGDERGHSDPEISVRLNHQAIPDKDFAQGHWPVGESSVDIRTRMMTFKGGVA
jgi:hypothetical protein